MTATKVLREYYDYSHKESTARHYLGLALLNRAWPQIRPAARNPLVAHLTNTKVHHDHQPRFAIQRHVRRHVMLRLSLHTSHSHKQGSRVVAVLWCGKQ